MPCFNCEKRGLSCLVSPMSSGRCDSCIKADYSCDSEGFSVAAARKVAKEQRRLEEAEAKVEGEFMLLQAESTRIHNEMNAKLAQITRLRRQRRQVESKGLDMLRRGLNTIDELEQAEKDENAAFEQAISEGTFHDWSAIVEQSEWDSLGLGQFIDPPFVVGGSSSGVAEHG
ncbi:hypothetical protein FOQG_16451 [Fusarium oxysporum f. sp. raphani 54005]|uniref:Zn(2)-C6 fungal-type domain-containing protein n=4 Tax=Fusarium oxysporum TaxID=5507 RepID=X0B9R5_FUSOX|nr:hypothetical protein FOQG_16451 [Fusarium oxysporum f. sp. raphani 54005]KAG6997126.1 hypothetical protein FocnCong_v015627 [Fusarium oxysporum f. sp. conglutinans]KAG7425010.1 hypothetical protein Forpi1262_v013753 [Fusarium oxysporum f. sp. raphani]